MTLDLTDESPQRFDKSMFPFEYQNTENIEKLRCIALHGDVHSKIPNLSRIIRLFISSTFKDMSDERDKILHEIYPKLEKYCSSKGYILQIVDMRWGIFESASNEQLTTDICLDEIKLARELSNGPFFIAILSHRYGSKFAPRSIFQTEFDLLLEQCDTNDQILLNKWYEIDKNNIPIVYNLKSLEDDNLKTQWETNDSRLVFEILRNSANNAKLDEENLIKYTRSVTEVEIQEGLFKTIDFNFRCLAFFRHINIFNQIKPGTIDVKLIDTYNKYIDINQKTEEIDYTCEEMIKNLKERITKKLHKRNLKEFLVDINSISELKQENFQNYLIEFTDLFERTVVNLVEANMNKNEILFHVLDNYADLFHHLRFSHEKVKGFMGRYSFINQIKSLLLEENIQYIVIHGISGSGKTSLIAKIAENFQQWFNHLNFTLILRFIGTSEDSYNIQNLLSSIMKQLAHRFNLIINYEELTPIDKLYNYFKKFLIEVSREYNDEHQIFILLDSLDQLSPEYGGRKLEWFPIDLPKNIHFIVSTLSDDQYEAFPAIQNLVKNISNNYIEITELNQDEIQSAIQYRLDNAKRTVTDEQMQYLLNLFQKCSIPLYIKLVMDQAIKWKHSNWIRNLFLSDGIKPAIHDLLEKLELSYGIVLVKKVLQYITLSRHGFYENYLENILANDQIVRIYITDQFKDHRFSSDKIPQIFLIRLIHALREYLSGPMYRWYHRAFWEVAYDRYCQDVHSNQNCHQTIVKTYQYEKFNKFKPFWMNELPYHATCANNLSDLKNNFLLNLKFLQIKAQGSDIDQLITDYDFAIKTHHDDQTLKLVHQVFLIAAYKIRQDPLQLPGQLYGRLCGYDEMNIDLNHLLEQCLSPPEDAIISDKRFMAGPNHLLSNSLIAHKTEIKSTLITNDNQKIISCSIDNCIKVFDGKTLTEKLTIYKKYDSTTILTISNDDTILYVWCRITEEKYKNQPIIEAYNLINGIHLFNVDPKILLNDSTKYREVLFSDLKDELWLITKNNWYHLNWQTGLVENISKNPKELTEKPDKIICIDKSQDRIVLGLDMESIVLSINENGKYTCRDLNNQTVMGRRFLILTNRTLAISTRRIFKSLYDDKDMEWFILLCHLETLEIQQRIPVNKALRMWKSSLDSTKIYCNAFNYIYILDIEKRQTDFILEHSSQMNSCSLYNQSTVISATWDNKLHIWNLSQSYQQMNNINLFDHFNSRMIRFLYDEFNTLSRYVFVYNVFDEYGKELFILYDLSIQQITRKCKIEEYHRNDLQPMCFINQQYVLLFCRSKTSYYFLDIDQFIIIKQFLSDETRVFKKIEQNHVIMSIRNDRDHTNSLVLLDCNLLCFEILIPMWNDIEWYTVNTKTILYKKKSVPTLMIFNINDRYHSVIPLENGDRSFVQIISSTNGKYLGIVFVNIQNNIEKSINVYQIENMKEMKLCFEKMNLKYLEQMKFVGDEYLIYQYREGSNRMTYCYDLYNHQSHLWFQDDDSQGLFDCLKHERSKYIWYQRYQVSRMNRVKTDISVFHIQDVSKPVCSLDVDCRLKINQVALFDNGNAMLVKVLDKLEFVAFFLKSKTKNLEENTIHFDQFRLHNSIQTLTLRKSTFYQFCRKFSFIYCANEF